MAVSTKDARKYLTKYKRLDLAVDAFYNSPPTPAPQASTSKLNALFDKYKGTSQIVYSLIALLSPQPPAK